jgi:beta-1,4-mannosyl-glycoprotein beta-1,4-N-acetylglucosaminyltransferase
LVESTRTFTGKEKKLYFNENKHLFDISTKKIEFNKTTHLMDTIISSKIIHIIVDDFPYQNPDFNKEEQWKNEHWQRNAITRGLEKLNLVDTDVIIISDVDEIPDPTILTSIKMGNIKVDVQILGMDLYYYNLTTKINSLWPLCKILSFGKYKELKKSCNDIRGIQCPVIVNGGWHLSYFGDKYFIQNKIKQFSHQEYNKDDYTNLENIDYKIKNGIDIFNRKMNIHTIELKNNNYLPPDYEEYLSNYINSLVEHN